MAASFESVKVPDRNDPSAKQIDNVVQTDASGVQVHRQAVALGDGVDHSLIAGVSDETPAFGDPGVVVRAAGEKTTLSLAEALLLESRKQTELLFYILHAIDRKSTVSLGDLGKEI